MNVKIVARRMVNLSDLDYYPGNPRDHDDHNIDVIKKSLKTFTHVGSLVVQESRMVVIGGNGTLQAMRALKWTKAHCIIVECTDVVADALNIALNQAGLTSSWNDKALGQMLEHVSINADHLVKSVGFDDNQLEKLIRAAGSKDEPWKPSIQDEAPHRVKAGDTWILGDHRLHCGDALDPTSYAMVEDRVHCIYTDPPYGVDYQDGAVANDNLIGDDLIQLVQGALEQSLKVARDDAAYYIWHAATNDEEFKAACRNAGLSRPQTLIWVKPSLVLGHADYQYQHEPCLYTGKDGHKPAWYGPRTETTVWEFHADAQDGPTTTIGNGLLLSDGTGQSLWLAPNPPKGKKIRRLRIDEGATARITTGGTSNVLHVARDRGSIHPTQKPLALIQAGLQNSTPRDGLVLDPFAGSGSTMMACEATGRHARIIELDPRRCDRILHWWEKETGKKARKESTQ